LVVFIRFLNLLISHCHEFVFLIGYLSSSLDKFGLRKDILSVEVRKDILHNFEKLKTGLTFKFFEVKRILRPLFILIVFSNLKF
jgi:hypothetical protein